MNIYRNMTYILYLFVLVVEGSAMCVVKGLGPILNTSLDNKLLAGTGWKPYLHSDWLKRWMVNRKRSR